MKSKINLLLAFSKKLGFLPPHPMHHVLHLILAIFLLFCHTVIESVLLFSHSRLAKPTFKEGTCSKMAKRAHINKIHCFDGKENFAILEVLKLIFWHFLQHFLHVTLQRTYKFITENCFFCPTQK